MGHRVFSWTEAWNRWSELLTWPWDNCIIQRHAQGWSNKLLTITLYSVSHTLQWETKNCLTCCLATSQGQNTRILFEWVNQVELRWRFWCLKWMMGSTALRRVTLSADTIAFVHIVPCKLSCRWCNSDAKFWFEHILWDATNLSTCIWRHKSTVGHPSLLFPTAPSCETTPFIFWLWQLAADLTNWSYLVLETPGIMLLSDVTWSAGTPWLLLVPHLNLVQRAIQKVEGQVGLELLSVWAAGKCNKWHKVQE